MKSAVCFLYILAQIIYLTPYLPPTKIVYAFGLITHVAMVGYLCHLARLIPSLSESERLMFQYAKYLSLANVIYIVACAFKQENFALYNTPLFAYILGIGLLVFLLHVAILNKS